MPLYEYVCESCGAEFEDLRRPSERGEESECPACGGRAGRVLSAFATPNGGATSAQSLGESSCSWQGG